MNIKYHIFYMLHETNVKRSTQTNWWISRLVSCIAIIVTVYFNKSSENVHKAMYFIPIHSQPNDINALFVEIKKTHGIFHGFVIVRHSKPLFCLWCDWFFVASSNGMYIMNMAITGFLYLSRLDIQHIYTEI